MADDYEDGRDIEEWASKKSKEIAKKLDNMFEEAHDRGLSYKEARNWVISQITRNIYYAEDTPRDVRRDLKTEFGSKMIVNMVDDAIKKRRDSYKEKYEEIMGGKDAKEIKMKKIRGLRKKYFGKDEYKKIKDEEKEKLRREKEEERKLSEEIYEAEIKAKKKQYKEEKPEWWRIKKKLDKRKDIYGSVISPEKGEFVKERKNIRESIRDIRGGEEYQAFNPLKMFDKDYREKRKASKSELKEKKEEMRSLRRKRKRSIVHGIEVKVGKQIMKGFTMAVFIGIGAVAMSVVGHWSFFLGFLAWGIYYLLPDPNDIKIPDELKEISEDNPLVGPFLWPRTKEGYSYFTNARTGWGVLRSMVKISVFGFFIYGIYTSPVPLGNIALIIISFFGYYSLKITYDVDKPYELLESLMRFAGLGFFFIPWIIMYGIFDSMLLAFIAMAFFAIPPIPKDRKSSELMAMYDFYDKIIFGVIMIGVLIGFFAGWEVSGSLSATFIYFWFVTGIAGFFSPAEARPAMGFLMLGAATIIYGIGPGTQETMSALFGPWWPTIQNTFSSISEPIGEAFGGFANTLRSGWLLLTNPVGYATSLMNGTHAENPTGKTGALGVQITDITISPLFPEQPFMITAMIKNEGSVEAEDVIMYLSTGYEAPRERKPSSIYGPLLLLLPKAHRPDVLKMSDMFNITQDEIVKCHENTHGNISDGCDNSLEKQNMWQETFISDGGISCNVINEYRLRERSIPVKVSVTYKYSSYSTVDVEFISNNEWVRLAESNQLNQRLRFILSQYSTAPVEFPIGTPGLKNPIHAAEPFHLGMRIESGSLKGGIESVEEIVMMFPKDFEIETNDQNNKASKCQPSGGHFQELHDSDFNSITWSGLSAGPKVFYCPFESLGEDKISGPTKTYVVKAFANYSYTIWREKDTKIEFGGKCCSDDDCLEGQLCSSDGMCVTEGAASARDICPGVCIEPSAEGKDSVISAAAAKYSVELDLVKALIMKESSNRHCDGEAVIKSSAGAMGIMQLMKDTAKDLGVNMCVFEDNVEGGVKYLSQNLNEFEQYDDQIMFALAAYNCGTRCVKNRINDYGNKWSDIESHLPLETQNYVSIICNSYYNKCTAA